MNNMIRHISSASGVLKAASEAGVQFSLFNDSLRLKLPKHGIAADLLEGIKQHKAEILTLLQNNVMSEARTVPDIDHNDENNRVKLTDLQESIWIAEKLADTAGLSNYCSVSYMDAKPNIDALNYAYKQIVERHIPLRTSIVEDQNGLVYQTALQDFDAEVIKIEQGSDDSENFDLLLKRVSRREFDFANELKLLFYLVEINDRDYRLIIVTHHLFTDGWSIGLLMDEINFFYNQYLNLEIRSLPKIEVTYFDYAVWANNRKESGQLLPALDYWENRLKDAPIIHSLPLDRPRPLALSFAVASLYKTTSSARLKEIKGFAAKQGVTLYTLLLSVYIVLLAKYSGERRHVIGTSVANRDKEILSPLIGLFTHTMPMMFEVDPKETFIELLKVVQKNYLGDMQYQGIQIEDIIRRIGHDTSTLSYAPLMQIAFFVQNNDFNELSLHGVNCKTSFVKTNVSLYDLGLSVTESDGSLELEWTYSTDLFNSATIERLAGHYDTLIEQLIASPERSLNSIQMMTAPELATIQQFSRNAALENAATKSIKGLRQQNIPLLTHKLFEKCVNANPSKTAVWSADGSLSYKELDARANRLAHWIIQQEGYTPGLVIGVALEKSPELVVALLAVMKAGGIYLPLDPKFPAARLGYMQSDSKVALVIAERRSLGNISEDNSRIVCLDDRTVVDNLANSSAQAPKIEIGEDQLVYILYTSGSTGQPKGVMIEHHSLAGFLLSVSMEPGIDINDRLLAISSISFDIHTLEIFLPLITGATLYFASPSEYADQSSLQQLIAREGISMMQATPSTWRILLDTGWQPAAPIKALCGGEALPEDIKNRLLQNDNIELWNMYGPTEATVWCCTKRVKSNITLGRPTAGASVHVLDENMHPVAIGVRGQLHIGGSCLARGYLNLSALTGQAFVRDVSHIENETRLYKSGDYVKWTEDGELVYLGRGDSQVKIRGHRIEISEITKALSDLPYVKEAAVVVREGKEGGKFLAAYIVPHDSSSFAVLQLRTDISEQLPEYMVPTVIEVLEVMPRTPNSKVDYESLKKLEIQIDRHVSVRPTTPIQHLLAELWQAVLPVTIDDIGIHDSFYSLGGNSMSALVFVARAKAKGLTIKPSELMKYPTIAQLEEVCAKTGAVAIHRAFSGEAPLTIDQKSILYQPVTRDCYFINVILDTPYSIDKDILAQAMDAVTAAHESLRAVFFAEADGTWKQKIVSEAPKQHILDFNLASNWDAVWNTDSAALQLNKFVSTLHSTMKIRSGPLMSAALITAENDAQKLMFSICHLVCDGFSLPIVIEDIFNTYKSLVVGNPVEIPASVSMDKWIFAYDDYIRSEAVQSSIYYWEGLPWHRLKSMALDFPADRTENTMSTVKTISMQLEPEFTDLFLSQRLQNLGVDHLEILVHVLTRTFAKWTDGEAAFINVFDTGRNMVPTLEEKEDLSRTVAAFAIGRALFLLNNNNADVVEGLLDTKAQIASIPLRGFSYRMLLHSEENQTMSARMKRLPSPEIWLNYYGVVDSIKSDEDLPTISPLVDKIDVVTMAPKKPRFRTVFLPWNVSNGKLNMVWEYSDKLHSRDTIVQLAEQFKSEFIGFLEAVYKQMDSADAGNMPSINRAGLSKAVDPVSEVISC